MMADPYCPECAQVTGGCWRHNGTGIYVCGADGAIRMTHAPARIATAYGWIQVLRPIEPGPIPVVDPFVWNPPYKPST